jgi:hypothetical protein
MTGSVPEVPLHHAGKSPEIGDLLARQAGAEPEAVVLDKSQDDGRLLVMSLSSGEVTEVAATDAASWTRVPGPLARWVEVYEVDDPSPFFAAYVPGIDSAIAIYRAFEARDGDFKVEIYTSDDRENEMLDGIGYFQ